MNVPHKSALIVSDQCKTFDKETHNLITSTNSSLNRIIEQNEIIISRLSDLIGLQEQILSYNNQINNNLLQIIQSQETLATIQRETQIIARDVARESAETASNTRANADDVAKISGAVRFGPTAIAIANTVATPIFTAPVG